MPKSRKIKVYTIGELSPEAKDRAIQKFRESGHAFDGIDSDQLTDSFEEFLEDKGIEDPSVNWSLGYSQGDGVCFSGSIEVRNVIYANKGMRKFLKLAELAMNDLFHARVEKGTGRYCHWNSMSVETKLDVENDYFMIEAELRELRHLTSEHAKAYREWEYLGMEIHRRNTAPERAWDTALEAWKERGGGGPREWNPRVRHPGEKPANLNEPTPPAPVLLLPPHLKEALEEADGKVKKAEALAGEFEKWLEEWVKNLSREMEKNGYSEIEYRDSEEVIIDFMDANEWTFLEDGGRAPR